MMTERMSGLSKSRGLLFAVAVVAMVLSAGRVQATETIRLGVLKFGTVNWALDSVIANGFDMAEGIKIEMVPLASKSAVHVALHSGSVDAIVTDWIWVNRQRAEGADYTFVPYSTALGSLMTDPKANITALKDLEGKRLGVAGGPLDKSWLMLRALGEQQLGYDLAGKLSPVFGAPPLLAEQLRQGRIDAVLIYWPYAARLEAGGYAKLMGVDTVTHKLGAEATPPLIGYVFPGALATAKPDALKGLFRSIAAANRLLATSDAEWTRLRPLMKAANDAEFIALRDGFRAGIPNAWAEKERTSAAAIFETLARIGGPKLVGPDPTFDPGVFWPGVTF